MAILLPAASSIILGKYIGASGSGASVKLYSPYPFPWRKNDSGLADGFSNKAWVSFLNDFDKPYFEFSSHKDKKILRYAVADKMCENCLNCQNTHPDSPRTDWTSGDVRGVLEVIIPMDNVLDNIKGE